MRSLNLQTHVDQLQCVLSIFKHMLIKFCYAHSWDELYDTGNGFANTDIARRAALIHGPLADAWVHLDLAVQHVESRRFGVEGLTQNAPLTGSKSEGGGVEKWVWSRSYTNYPLHLLKADKVAMGEYPIVSPNRFDIATIRANGPHAGEGELEKAISGMLGGELVDGRWRMFHGSEGRYVLSPRIQSEGAGAMLNASAFEALASGEGYRGWAGMEKRGRPVFVNSSTEDVKEKGGANARVLVVLDHEGVGGASEDSALNALATAAAAKVIHHKTNLAGKGETVSGLWDTHCFSLSALVHFFMEHASTRARIRGEWVHKQSSARENRPMKRG
jgi:hypothetical protein